MGFEYEYKRITFKFGALHVTDDVSDVTAACGHAHPQAVCCGAEGLIAASPTTQLSHHSYLPPTPMFSKTVLAFDIYGTPPEASN